MGGSPRCSIRMGKKEKCSINKTTGSVQVFDVQEVTVEQQVESKPGIFDEISDKVLTTIGVPQEQFELVRGITNLDDLYDKKSSIPEEAYEALEWIGNGLKLMKY